MVTNDDTADAPSGFTIGLTASGFLGVAAGLGLEFFRLAMTDPLVGPGSVAGWVEPVRFSLLVGSLVVLAYALVFDDCFSGWADLVFAAALVGQWGVPVGQYLDATIGGLASPYGYFVLVCAALQALVALAVAGASLWAALDTIRRRRTDEGTP